MQDKFGERWTVNKMRLANIKATLALNALVDSKATCDNCEAECYDTHEIRVRYDAFRYGKSIEVCLKCRDKLCYEDMAAVEVL